MLVLPSNAVAGVREGEVIAGKYRIDGILGAGGMGVVVAAHHVHLDERVAIKFLLPEALGSQDALARFMREARAAVRIKSEHVARVIDVGTLDSGSPYIVMEFLQGSDLAAWLQQRGALGIEQTADLLLQACEAIAEAHALGIVHRDLKPANLFVVRGADGLYSLKVLDFGISKVSGLGASTTDMGLTKTTAVMGSPMYMSPEQMEASRNVDARTDIWALGVILFELVTGKVPFDGETVPEVCVRIVSHSPPPLWNLRPDAPAGLEAIMLRCLEKDRTKRYANVAELAVALSEFGSKRGKASAERVLRVVQSAGLGGADSMPPSSSSPRPPGTIGGWGQNAARSLGAHKAALGGVAALGAFFGMAIVLAMMKSSGQASPVTVTAAESSPAPSRATSPVDVRSVPIGPAAATLEPEPGAKPMFRVDAGLPVAPRTLSTVAPSGVGAAAHATPLGATATPPSKPNPNCDPPFTVDIAGIKHAKPECL